MSELMHLVEKLDSAGKVIPNCREASHGYTVSETGRPGPLRFAVKRPGAEVPFVYLGQADEIEMIIAVDRYASSKPVTQADFKHLELQP
ncbi:MULTISPECIES: hypothetical protein [Pseudomonas]|uniref:hypothetical protein n=1 Tax=Pseudomonas nitroreducens TaxID=46680 RepID=UPI001E6356F5|nr:MULTISPECIES: hypothetical protein [Pseudomonas]MCE4073526.1 hypothetical protein [Pseudomonas nitritireducens]MCE4079765.1 hypothetical protein [Pseudomonas nitroreducens]